MKLSDYFEISIYIACIFLIYFALSPLIKEPESTEARVERIYHELMVQTGLRQKIPGIRVEYNKEINAYTDGTIIVVYTGLVDFTNNDDELALVIGHEMAHDTLDHVLLPPQNADNQSILESLADKMGAFYMMKAGYDVCRGRGMWKRLQQVEGDYLGRDHPDMAYRYTQLNVMCE